MKRLSCFAWLLWVFPMAASAVQSLNAQSLESHIPALMKEAQIPGLSVAVVKQGTLSWQKQYGTVDVDTGKPVKPDTLFEAASLSKPVLAYIALKMAKRGELDLNRPLATYLTYPRFANQPQSLTLTARHVLSHQGGLPNWGGTPLQFEFSPGERFQYSGEGYVYLQNVLEDISGLDLHALAVREVFKPLGMTQAYFTWPQSHPMPRAKGHTQLSAPVERDVPSANGAFSLHTTAEDYARFVIAWLDPSHPDRNALRLAFEPQIKLKGNERGPVSPFTQPGMQSWGLGWGLQMDKDREIAWHWGDNGPFRAFVAMNLTDKSAVVYFANSQNGLAVAQRITEAVVGDMGNIIRWLDYGQSHEGLWQAGLQALHAESNGDLSTAIKLYKQMLIERPELEQYQRRIDWIQAYVKAESQPLPVSDEQQQRFAGQYGPRNLIATEQGLAYFRGNNAPVALIQLAQNRFALQGKFDFQLEVATDDKGRPIKLVGHYLSGHRDESPRN